MELESLQPNIVWKHFYDLNQVPRPSKKEEKVIAFMKKFGKDLGLETLVDDCGNVLIRKPATKGFEQKQTIVLQSHLDMVHQKNEGVEFNFDKDAIQMHIEGDWLKAKGTTLGADNGIGTATSMAVLSSKDIEHGPIEALFTIDEETGMTGAFGLKPGFVKGDIMLNLDSEDEGEIYISCAGGLDTNVYKNYKEEKSKPENTGLKIIVKGLRGGHSGMDIASGRGNANKILSRVLLKSYDDFGFQISAIKGGTARNAIPREAFAVGSIDKTNKSSFIDFITKIENDIFENLKSAEPNFKIEIEEVESPEFVMENAAQTSILNSIYACPNGVYRMSVEIPDLVETSTNLSKINLENGKLEINCLNRSSVNSAKLDVALMIEAAFQLCGATVEHTGNYPGWKPNPNSKMLKEAIKVHEKVMGFSPKIKAVHAGLECGIIGDIYPQLDMISFGPNIRNAHSPEEMVQISSVEKFWNYFLEVLKAAPNK